MLLANGQLDAVFGPNRHTLLRIAVRIHIGEGRRIRRLLADIRIGEHHIPVGQRIQTD